MLSTKLMVLWIACYVLTAAVCAYELLRYNEPNGPLILYYVSAALILLSTLWMAMRAKGMC